MRKETNDKSKLTASNNIYLIIQELKKIIDKWQSGELYRSSYDQGSRGKTLYGSIVASIYYDADGLSDNIIENAEKFGVDPNIEFFLLPKSDIRSIGFEVLTLLDSSWIEPVENLIYDDIPAILEFLDTPSGKLLEAWDKWEKYWANLDYPERRRNLLEYNNLRMPTFPEDEYLAHTKTKVTISRLSGYSEQGIIKAHEVLNRAQKRFEGKKLTHETIDLLDKDTSRTFYEFEDGNFINLTTKGTLGEIDREITMKEIREGREKSKKYYANSNDLEQRKELQEYNDFKMLGFPEDDYIITPKTRVLTNTISYHNEGRVEKAQELFHIIKKEFHGRKLIHERTEVVDKNTFRIIYEFEDGSCIQLITNGKLQP